MRIPFLPIAFLVVLLPVTGISREEPQKVLGLVSGERINVRTSPSVKAAVAAQLRNGEPVWVLEQGKKKVKIGSRLGYWLRIDTQEGVAGWMFGPFVTVLDQKTKGREAILMQVLEKEFPTGPFRKSRFFSGIRLESIPFQKRFVHVLWFQWQEGSIGSCEGAVYIRKNGWVRIGKAGCGDLIRIFDMEGDGSLEVVVSDAGRGSYMFVYSEKEEKELFQYSLYSDDASGLLEDPMDSSIEIEPGSNGRPFTIRVHRRISPDRPMKDRVYEWENGTFILKTDGPFL
jgi:hypothetical protein